MMRTYTIDNLNGINGFTFNFSDELLNTKITVKELLEKWPINRDPICTKSDYAEGYNHCLIDVLTMLSKIEPEKS